MKNGALKWLYIGFVIFGIYLLFGKKEFSEAAIYFGIALAFDPFNQDQAWKERPTWQKVVLIAHLAIVAGLFGYDVGFNDSLK